MNAMRLSVDADVTTWPSEGQGFRFRTPPQFVTHSIRMRAASWFDSASPEAKAFIDAHNLKSEIRHTVALIHDHFPPGIVVSLQVETDPEAEGTWLVIDVKTWGGADTAVRAYNGFVKEWVVAIPPSVRDTVRVTFNLSESWTPASM
jgi:hypothetical protein